MRTGQLSSVGNYRGARSELQSGQDPASKRQKVRERERERERENGRGKRGGGDAIFTPIYGEIPGRGTLTTSKQDLWKTPGDLRYHYLPRSGTVFRWTLMPAWFHSISFHRKKMLAPLDPSNDTRSPRGIEFHCDKCFFRFFSMGLILFLEEKGGEWEGWVSVPCCFSLVRSRRRIRGGEKFGGSLQQWVMIYFFIFIIIHFFLL